MQPNRRRTEVAAAASDIFAGSPESSGRRVVEFGRRQVRIFAGSIPADDEDRARHQHDGRVPASRRGQRSRRAEGAGGRIEDLGAGQRCSVVSISANNQDALVGEKGCRVETPRRGHRSHGAKRARDRVVGLCTVEYAGGPSAGDEDVTVGKKGRGVQRPGSGHVGGARERPRGLRGRGRSERSA